MRSLFLVLMFAFSQYTLWCGASGVSSVVALNRHIKLQQQENKCLLESVKRLEHKVHDLKEQPAKSSALLEDHMRWKLGLIKQGEWFCCW